MRVLLSRGLTSLIDDEDWPLVADFRWFARPVAGSDTNFYAFASVRRRTIYLHRVIAQAEPGELVDHRNSDGLDNRRSNLRIATRRQNNINRAVPPPKSGFRGVYPDHGRWRVSIYRKRRHVSVGFFSDVIDAAKAYDAAAREEYGEFAILNFPGVV